MNEAAANAKRLSWGALAMLPLDAAVYVAGHRGLVG